MSEKLELRYCTELELKEDFLRKALKASAIKPWRKVFWAIWAGIYVLLLGISLWSCVQTKDCSSLMFSLAVGVAVIGLVWFSTRQAINVSLRRWKEQNHEEAVHIYGGFTKDGYVQSRMEKDDSITLYYADVNSLTEVDGVWVICTKAGLLAFYNAASLTKTDLESVLTLLQEKNPKIKIKLPKA